MQARSQSNEAIAALEQTVAELTMERNAAEAGAEEARQALAAAQVQLKQLQGEHAAMAAEHDWALESSGALQVHLTGMPSTCHPVKAGELCSPCRRHTQEDVFIVSNA